VVSMIMRIKFVTKYPKIACFDWASGGGSKCDSPPFVEAPQSHIGWTIGYMVDRNPASRSALWATVLM
jgi:hypothetical protein